MITEKEQIERILKERGILVNGAFDETRFNKLVTEPWIYNKTIKYGLNKSDVVFMPYVLTDTTEPVEIQSSDNELVIEKSIDEPEEVVELTVEVTSVTESEVVETEETSAAEEVLVTEPEVVETEETLAAEETPEATTNTQSKKKSTKKK